MNKPNAKNKTYYIIGKDYSGNGLFALYIWICAQIIYAKQKGFIPVIDMKHHNSQFFKDNRVYKDNVWEYFFEQPENIGLDDIPTDANIIIAGDDIPKIQHLWVANLPLSKQNQKDPTFADENIKYFKLNTEIKNYIAEKYKEITKGNTNILGILCRGTDYTNLKPLNHAIQPTAEEIIKKAEELFKEYKYDKIWLATEDEIIYQKFKDKFKDKLLPNNQYKFSNTKKSYLSDIKAGIKDFKYHLNRDYLLSMYILSKCKYFIGGRTSGTVAVYLFSNKFENQEYVYLWNKGCYGKEKRFIDNIFSIKKENKHIVINLLGIRLKFKKYR